MQGRLSPTPAQSRAPAGQTHLEGRGVSRETSQPLVWEPQQRFLLPLSPQPPLLVPQDLTSSA